jgi:hypothetical protein
MKRLIIVSMLTLFLPAAAEAEFKQMRQAIFGMD